MPARLLRYAAFTTDPKGGNPAGIWIGDALPDEAEMQRIAAEVGLPNTAFIAPAQGAARTARYFSPAREIGFCGHATIATAVIFGKEQGAGTYRFSTPVGDVPVSVREREGRWEASLTSIVPRHEPVPPDQVAAVLDKIGWTFGDLDPAIPFVRANAGNWHLVLAARTKERHDRVAFDFESLRKIMLGIGVLTLQLVWRERADLIHSRNPFPPGGVVEDPASGSAAAALAGYLRDAGLISVPATIVIRQGEAMGRPSTLYVQVPVSGGIVVSGNAVPL